MAFGKPTTGDLPKKILTMHEVCVCICVFNFFSSPLSFHWTVISLLTIVTQATNTGDKDESNVCSAWHAQVCPCIRTILGTVPNSNLFISPVICQPCNPGDFNDTIMKDFCRVWSHALCQVWDTQKLPTTPCTDLFQTTSWFCEFVLLGRSENIGSIDYYHATLAVSRVFWFGPNGPVFITHVVMSL